MVIFYSFFFVFFQIILASYITPKAQDGARSIIRNSNIDFFPSLIKEGKFIDTVKNLTIFIESKDLDGNYNNIFLEDLKLSSVSAEPGKSQIIYAKKGLLKNDNGKRYLELIDGKIINNNNFKLTSFSFKKIDFNLSKYTSKSTTFPKMQELSSMSLFKCLYYYFKFKGPFNSGDKKTIDVFLICDQNSIKDVKEEFFKRFYKPINIPLIALLTCLIILVPKEHQKYNVLKFIIFLAVVFIIVISEASLRYIGQSVLGASFFIFFPLILFLTIYINLFIKLKN